MRNYKVLENAPRSVKGMVGLARALALPHEYSPERFPSFPALERTSILGVNYNGNMSVSGDTHAMLVRDPMYPFWADVEVSDCTVWGLEVQSYPLTPSTIVSAGQTGIYQADVVPMQTPADMAGAFVGESVPSNCPFKIEGVKPPPCRTTIVGLDPSLNNDLPFLYFPGGQGTVHMYIHVWTEEDLATADGNSFGVRLSLEAWHQPGHSTTFSPVDILVPRGSTHGMQSVSLSTTYRGQWIRIVGVTLTSRSNQPAGLGLESGRVNIAMLASTGELTYNAADKKYVGSMTSPKILFMPVAHTKEFYNSVIPWSSTKLTAVSVLATNVSKVLNKEGTVLAGRISPAHFGTAYGPFGWKRSDLETLHPAEKAYLGLEQGFYTYAPPAGDMASFISHLVPLHYTNPAPIVSGGGVTLQVGYALAFNLANTSFVNAVVFHDPDGDTNLALNVDWHVEFRNNSVLFPIGMSYLSLEMYHQAQLTLGSIGFFFNNEPHEKTINHLTKKIAEWANRLAPVASLASPLVGRGMQIASDMVLSTIPKQTVQPTALSTTSKPRSSRASSVDSRISSSSKKQVTLPLSKSARKRARRKAKLAAQVKPAGTK